MSVEHQAAWLRRSNLGCSGVWVTEFAANPRGTFYCSRRFNPFIANTRVLISSIDSSVASR